jgi:hypothetical protein
LLFGEAVREGRVRPARHAAFGSAGFIPQRQVERGVDPAGRRRRSGDPGAFPDHGVSNVSFRISLMIHSLKSLIRGVFRFSSGQTK